MDYLKTVVPSQLMAERGSNLVVINPGSANVRMGFASQDVPFNIPHCIARRINPQEGKEPKFSVRDQMLNCRASSSQNAERESAYDIIAALMKIPFLDEEMPSLNQPLPPRMGRVDGFSSQQSRDDSKFTWTNVTERSIKPSTSIVLPNPPNLPDRSVHKDAEEDTPPSTSGDGNGHDFEENKYKEVIFGEDALKIPPSESYCLSRPIRRGHFNVSHNYSLHQVLEDLRTIWNWILTEKLHINPRDRGLYSAILVLGETFDNREIKEMMSIVLHDLGFSTAVVHQEALAAAFGNGLSTACVVNIGAQVTQVVCVEDGVALPHTALALPYGGDSGTFDAVTLVHSYDNERSAGHQKTRLSALNVPPMGLLYPRVLVPEEYPPPPRSWFQDYDDMLEDTWQTSDSLYPSGNGGYGMWDNYPMFPTRLKKFDNIGLVEAIVSSILSTGRVDLQRKLFCSIQLVGGAASTAGLAPVLEQRILNKIPANQSVERVEVLQSRTYPLFVPWKGGVILGVLDTGRDAWIHREDWIKNGVHIGSGRKYKDSYFLQAQVMCYYNI
ncbi:actin-related protein 9 isoform X3 [Panicum virgatum]|uniref:actin-related protein 9 isoform X3 n=1 Tax=Panicum virgatum TaxID=38727 RepID=UPI0019D5675C|nr:actin-related protein 9 isoform X3 [Panicum virgatum]